jgi:hypothetical protein
MGTYWADVAFIVAPREEKALLIQFEAKSPKDAVKDAARFGHNRAREFGWKLCCIKVGRFEPQPIDPEGYFRQASQFGFFEWKYDWPGTLDERIEVFSEKE